MANANAGAVTATTSSTAARQSAGTKLAWAGFALAVVSALMLLNGAFGYRAGWVPLRQALFTWLRWGAYVGGAAGVVSIVAAIASARGPRRSLTMALVGLVLGAVTFGLPASWRLTANGLPPIHDITTDTQDPPQFVAVLPLRANAPNPTEYGGAQVAERQRGAYPDLEPLVVGLPPDQAFDRALETVRDMGWDLVAAEASEGRIEATDTTFWFGFKDDVVIRIRPETNGSRIDVRSLSRVGGGDVGTNATRIRRYLDQLRSRV